MFLVMRMLVPMEEEEEEMEGDLLKALLNVDREDEDYIWVNIAIRVDSITEIVECTEESDSFYAHGVRSSVFYTSNGVTLTAYVDAPFKDLIAELSRFSGFRYNFSKN